MKAWDTNVLIRHLTEDDEAQTKVARSELEKAQRRSDPIWLSLIVMVETSSVLGRYGLNKTQTLTVLNTVCQDTRFQIEGGSLLVEAIKRSNKKGDLPEHIAALAAKATGIKKTQTFDKAVKDFSEFEVL